MLHDTRDYISRATSIIRLHKHRLTSKNTNVPSFLIRLLCIFVYIIVFFYYFVDLFNFSTFLVLYCLALRLLNPYFPALCHLLQAEKPVPCLSNANESLVCRYIFFPKSPCGLKQNTGLNLEGFEYSPNYICEFDKVNSIKMKTFLPLFFPTGTSCKSTLSSCSFSTDTALVTPAPGWWILCSM